MLRFLPLLLVLIATARAQPTDPVHVDLIRETRSVQRQPAAPRDDSLSYRATASTWRPHHHPIDLRYRIVGQMHSTRASARSRFPTPAVRPSRWNVRRLYFTCGKSAGSTQL